MSENEREVEYIQAPDFVKPDDSGSCKAFFITDKGVVGPSATEEFFKAILNNSVDSDAISKTLSSAKTPDSTFQKGCTTSSSCSSSESVVKDGVFEIFTTPASKNFKIQQPPYDPNCFANFTNLSVIHYRCVCAKVRDSVGRSFKIKSKHPILSKEVILELKNKDTQFISEEEFEIENKIINEFIESCNPNEDFAEVCYKVGMDMESIGWGAFEVVRNATGKIARLYHIPAANLRVLAGYKGFVEELKSLNTNTPKYRYYLPFGQKFGKFEKDPFDLSVRPKKVFTPYNPNIHGELTLGGPHNLTFNLVHNETGDPLKGSLRSNFKKSANEVLFVKKSSNLSNYYGYSDVLPAVSAIVANVFIDDYMIQFFEHNCIPRCVVTINGGVVDNEFIELVSDYFENRIKGSSHKTLVMALGGYQNKNVQVDFQFLDKGNKEADFLQTRKDNDQRIMTAHGIPPAVLGINESSNIGSGKGISQADMYKNRIVVQLQRYWASRLNNLFKLGLGCLHAKIEFDPLDIRDWLNIAQSLNLLLSQGVITINEARRHLGLDGVLPGGDNAFVRVSGSSLFKVEDIPKLLSKLEDMEASGKASDIDISNISSEDKNLNDSIMAKQE